MADMGKAPELCSSCHGSHCHHRGSSLLDRLHFPESDDSNLHIVIRFVAMGDKKWYVLRTAGSKEKKVKEYLDKEGDFTGAGSCREEIYSQEREKSCI